jgi:hypothetical protein
MKVAILIVAVGVFLTGLSCGLANAQWRTPPIKVVGTTGTVSCDLVNNSGGDLTWSNLLITVQTLEWDLDRIVVQVPGPEVVPDGRGFRGSRPDGSLPIRTVYCELDANSVVSTTLDNLLFTMSVDDQTGKAVTVAIPPSKKIKWKLLWGMQDGSKGNVEGDW